jgi:cytoskeletal protein CcmA (bactofilin family)
MLKTDDPKESQQSIPETQHHVPPATGTQLRTLPGVSFNSQEQATIGKSLAIQGEVSGSESLYIDGRVEGSINLPEHCVTVGRNGVVSANITAREIVILGTVQGMMTASDRLHISSEGALTGDVITQRVSLEEGAYFKGSIDIRKGNADSNEISSGQSNQAPATSG